MDDRIVQRRRRLRTSARKKGRHIRKGTTLSFAHTHTYLHTDTYTPTHTCTCIPAHTRLISLSLCVKRLTSDYSANNISCNGQLYRISRSSHSNLVASDMQNMFQIR